jgi:2-polyprenyl-3-methyl-5-hydroxy-6-metoxy-1,4-benzoquinol methylase
MTSAAVSWKELAERHHAQTERAREDGGVEEDFWAPIASRFRDDPSREDDPVLNRLVTWVDAESTVLDVGGGAGRFAIPLAKRCRQVTLVDPSAAMLETLKTASADAGVENITSVQSNWEDAEVERADLVLCAHVVYGVTDIEPFLRKLESHAKQRVVVVSHTVAPVSMMATFWKAVHGEERITLPGFNELVPVLREMGRSPDIEMLDATEHRGMPDRGVALEWLRHLAWVAPDSDKDRVLQKELDAAFDAEQGLYVLRRGSSQRGIVTWLTE